MNASLKFQLGRVAALRRRFELRLKLAGWWAAVMLAGLSWLLVQRQTGWSSALALPTAVALGLAGAIVIAIRHRRHEPDWRRLARELETRYPDLDGRLVTAVQQQPREGEDLNYLQERVVWEALRHSQQHDWTESVSGAQRILSRVAHWAALFCLALTLLALRVPQGTGLLARAPRQGSVTVTPGDTALERGSSLVVLARFVGTVPAGVELVIGQPPDRGRIPLVKSLADPMFGGSVPEVTSNLVYHVAYDGRQTREFKVEVFDYPRLERADLELTFPDYTGLPPKRIEDTRRLSAVEGSRLDLVLRFNKRVSTARLIPKNKETAPISLVPSSNAPAAEVRGLWLESSQTYDLQLLDADGRSNKIGAQFVFDVQPNRVPEIRLASPRGDLRPSPLEEITFDGTVWDDFAVKAYGLGYAMAGQQTRMVELGRDVPAKEKRAFKYVLRLEELGVQPDRLISWFVWADDVGPNGQLRHTTGDLYFGEVRPFDEVFREGQSMAGQGGGGQSGQQEEGQGQAERLAELQKQIINATWRLQREQPHSNRAAMKPQGQTAYPGSVRPRDIAARDVGGPHEPGSTIRGGIGGSGTSAQVERCEDRLKAELWRSEFRLQAARAGLQLARAATVVGRQGCRRSQSLAQFVAPMRSQRLGLGGYECAAAKVALSTRSPSRRYSYAVMAQVASSGPPDQIQRARERLAAVSTNTPASGRVPTYEDDIEVVRAAQEQALEQLRETQSRTGDPRTTVLVSTAAKESERALELLKQAAGSREKLAEALVAEQAAYQALLELQEHEYEVTQSRNRRQQGGGNARNQQMQRQLEAMEMTQSENRYETQRQAQNPSTGQRNEQVQAMNRLQELARRQQDLNERLKELQTALQEARTEADRAELQRRLKRLQEEEQQMLADLDELRQRMDRPETQSRMAEERRQLEQTRSELQRAAEAAGQGSPSQALASGTRAQRQLQEMREQLRRENSSQFAEDLREMRSQARELSRQQQDIARQAEAEARSERKSLSDSPERQALLEQLGRQRDRLTNLVDRATQLSEQAEAAEPLLSRSLYDALRKFSQESSKEVKDLRDQLLARGMMTRSLYDRLNDASEPEGAKLQDLTSEMLRLGFPSPANQAAERARPGIDNLRRGVEGATESVLGDDTEALRLAQQQLEQLTDQVEREITQAEAGGTNAASTTNTFARTTGEDATNLETNRPTSEPRPGGAAPDGRPAVEPGSQGGSGARARPETAANDEVNRRGSARDRRQASGARYGSNAAGGDEGGDLSGSLRRSLDRLLDEDGLRQAGPVTGDDFVSWSDRLREVEEMIELPELRNEVAAARDRARQIRQQYRTERKKPDWAVVRLQVVNHLAEVRQRIAEELAQRASRESTTPIDRDPVPNRYSELVRRYYEELGKEK